MDIIFTFPNTSAVIAAEQVLLSSGISVKVRPIPTVIRAGCGLSLCISPNFKLIAEELLKNNSIDISAIYKFEDGTYLLID